MRADVKDPEDDPVFARSNSLRVVRASAARVVGVAGLVPQGDWAARLRDPRSGWPVLEPVYEAQRPHLRLRPVTRWQLDKDERGQFRYR
jgi:hypothetical protein